MDKPTEIGRISACIAGDHRYTTQLTVLVDDTKAHIVISENGAVGGMDGPGGSYGFRETSRLTVEKTPAAIIAGVKRVINSESPSIIKTYGKPTKYFKWHGVKDKGLAARLVIGALSFLDE